MEKEQNREELDMTVQSEDTAVGSEKAAVSEDSADRPVKRRPTSEQAASGTERPVRKRSAAENSAASDRPVRKRPAAEGAATAGAVAAGERPVRKRPAAEGSTASGTDRPVKKRPAAEGSTASGTDRPVRKRPAAEGAGTETDRPVKKRPAAEGAAAVTDRPVRKRPVTAEAAKERPVKTNEIQKELLLADMPKVTESLEEPEKVSKKKKAEPKKKKKKKKRGGLGILLMILLLLIGVLVFLVTQLNEMRNGGKPVWEQLFKNEKTSEIPTLITEEHTEKETETEAIETGSNEAVVTEPVPTAEPTVAQTFQNDEQGNLVIPAREAGSFQTAPAWQSVLQKTGDEVLDTANYQAAMYDYDTAIATIQAVSGYESNQTYVDAIASYEQQKSLTVRYGSNSTIPHVFFHSLVVDTSRAFDTSIAISNQDGVCKVNDYNYVMTTVKEFVRILESMYNDGYVLVSIYDIAAFETAEDGSQVMKHQPIYLPEGKKPFVMSIDDVSYYEYMTGHGFATKLVVGEDGKVTNEYILEDGTKIYGSYDVPTILDDFIETHPDFSYRGAKGIIALTGYEGIFGYRTSDYWYNDNCEYFNPDHAAKRAANKYYHNTNMEADKAAAKQVAEALKADGWLFASHTWGHNRVGDSNSYEFIEWDTMMWEREVEPLIGDTDIIIFPQGEDLYTGSWRGYDPNNAKYQLLKSVGFDYFCNVDSNLGWTQLGSDHFRMARSNLDGQRMWEALTYYNNPESGAKDRLSTLFDSRLIFDWSRPTPVTK